MVYKMVSYIVVLNKKYLDYILWRNLLEPKLIDTDLFELSVK